MTKVFTDFGDSIGEISEWTPPLLVNSWGDRTPKESDVDGRQALYVGVRGVGTRRKRECAL